MGVRSRVLKSHSSSGISYCSNSEYWAVMVKGEFQTVVLNLIHHTNREQTRHEKVLFVNIVLTFHKILVILL